jgi:hypothetical protein
LVEAIQEGRVVRVGGGVIGDVQQGESELCIYLCREQQAAKSKYLRIEEFKKAVVFEYKENRDRGAAG